MRVIAVEGVDGAGKATTARFATQVLTEWNLDPVSVSFPRYDGPYGDRISASLRSHTANAGLTGAFERALLFALDRRDFLDGLSRDATLVADRWTASNAAYLCALSGAQEDMAWIADLEFDRLKLTSPSMTIHVLAEQSTQFERMSARAAEDEARPLDGFEVDRPLQVRVARVYQLLADMSFGGEWAVLENRGTLVDLETNVREKMAILRKFL